MWKRISIAVVVIALLVVGYVFTNPQLEPSLYPRWDVNEDGIVDIADLHLCQYWPVCLRHRQASNSKKDEGQSYFITPEGKIQPAWSTGRRQQEGKFIDTEFQQYKVDGLTLFKGTCKWNVNADKECNSAIVPVRLFRHVCALCSSIPELELRSTTCWKQAAVSTRHKTRTKISGSYHLLSTTRRKMASFILLPKMMVAST